MNKKIFLIPVLILLFIPITFAAIQDGMLLGYSFNNTATTGDHVNDTDLFRYNATVQGSVTTGTGMPLGEGITVTKAANYILIDNLTTLSKTNEFSGCLWTNMTDVAGSQTLIRKGSPGGGDNTLLFYWTSAGDLSLFDGSTESKAAFAPNDDQYYFLCFVLNSTNEAEFYVDGTRQPLTSPNTLTYVDDNDPWHFCGGWSGVGFAGDCDQGIIWNRTVLGSEFESINNTPISEIIPPSVILPEINITSPQNNTRNNSFPLDIIVNVTDSISDNFTCILRNASTIFNISVVQNGVNTPLTFDNGSGNINQNILFNITCNNTQGNIDTELLNITLDTIVPVIVTTSPENNSVYDRTFTNLSFSSLCTDQELLAFNMSLINKADGSIPFSVQNNTFGAEMLLEGIIDLSGITPGEYQINYTCVDPHTASDSLIFNYTFNVSGDELIFYGIRDAEIVIGVSYSEIPLCDYGSYSLWDREVFWFDFETCNTHIPVNGSKLTYRWKIKDKDYNLQYIPQSPFKGHFVTRDHYVTFHTLNPENSYAITEVIPGYKSRVRIRSTDRYFTFDHSIGGLNRDEEFLNVNITETLYTSMQHIDFEVQDVLFDSPTFIPILNDSFNLSMPSRIIISTSLNAEKFTLPQSSEVSIRFELDDVIISEQDIITLTALGDVKSVNVPFVNSTLGAGEHFLTVSVAESGTGSVLLDNIHLHFITNQTQTGEVITDLQPFETTFSSTSFSNILTWNIVKTVEDNILNELPVYVEPSVTFSSLLGDTPTCRISDGTHISPAFTRTVGAAFETGSSGIVWKSDNNQSNVTFNLQCRTDGGNSVIANGSVFSFVLGHNGSGTHSKSVIPSEFNSLKTLTTVNGVEQDLVNIPDYNMLAGTGLSFTTTTILDTNTGTQVPFIFLNTSTLIREGHDRTLTTDGDIATVKFYDDSTNASELSPLSSSLSIDVLAGEGVDIFNASLVFFEISTLNISVGNLPPAVTITNPLNEEMVKNFIDINFSVFDAAGDTTLTNVTIENATDTIVIGSNLPDSNRSIRYNFSTLGLGDYTLRVISSENDTVDLFTGQDTINITVVGLIINLESPLNESEFEGFSPQSVTQIFSIDEADINCSLIINNHVNQTLLTSIGNNTYDPLTFINGTYDWFVRCNGQDSEEFTFDVLVNDFQVFDITECPNTIPSVLILTLMFLLSITFIVIGFVRKEGGVPGIFGGFLLIILSWYISACITIFSFGLGMLGILLIIIFAAKFGLSGLKFF